VSEFLSQPIVAGVLGALVGFGAIAGVAFSPRFVRSGGQQAATGVMMGAMALSMILIMTVLLVYVVVAPDGFFWFGLSLAGGFIVGLAAMAVFMVRAQNAKGQGR